MGTSPSLPTPAKPASSSPSDIPSAYTLTYKKSFTKVICYVVPLHSPPSSSSSSPQKKAEALFTVSLPKGWYSDIFLHAGPDAEAPVIASVRGKERYKLNEVAFYDTSQRPDQAESLSESTGKEGYDTEIIRRDTTHKDRYYFATRTPTGISKYEWRRSHGAEVKSLKMSSHGWKLVRVASLTSISTSTSTSTSTSNTTSPALNLQSEEKDHESGSSDTSEKAPGVKNRLTNLLSKTNNENKKRREGHTSDDKPIVALWAPHANHKFSDFFTVGKFQFYSDDIFGQRFQQERRQEEREGEMGGRFRVLVLMSVLVIWRAEMQSAIEASISAPSV